MEKEQVLAKIDELIQEGDEIFVNRLSSFYESPVDNALFRPWKQKIVKLVKDVQIHDERFTEIKDYKSCSGSCKRAVARLRELRDLVDKDKLALPEPPKPVEKVCVKSMKNLNLLFDRFHKVARQIKKGAKKLPKGEEDQEAQDVLYSLLQIYFDDIWKGEWTPRYAGGKARIGFLLKKDRIVVEVKRATKDMSSETLADELVIDVERYKENHSCDMLVCFVYDPEGFLPNPQAIMKQLNQIYKGVAQIIIKPEH